MDWSKADPNQQAWYPNYGNYQYPAGTQMPPQWPTQPYNYQGYYANNWNYGTAPNFNVPPPATAPPPPNDPPLPNGLPPLPPDPPPEDTTTETPEKNAPKKDIVDEDSSVPKQVNYPYSNPPLPFTYMAYPPPIVNNKSTPNKVTNNPIKFSFATKNIVSKDSFVNETSVKSNQNQSETTNWSSLQVSTKGMLSSTNDVNSKGSSDMDDWPISLRNYVERCFARCKTDLDKDQVEICLKGKLTLATKSNSIKTKNWDNEPLISIFSQKDAPNNKVAQFDSKNFKGDPSRGFSVKRKSPSRSPSPNRHKKHSSSEETESDFIPITVKKKRGNKKRFKGRLGVLKQGDNSPFYSKHGADFVAEESFSSTAKLEKRAARFAVPELKEKWSSPGANKKSQRKRKKLNLSESINSAFIVDGNDIDLSAMHIIGTSTVLEKKYLRLTSAPEASSVRTRDTLKRALLYAKTEWKANQDYRATCDRLKSIRQDLTIQAIRDTFTVQVYETHCRVALETGDIEEFNQSQSQLKQLYAEIGGENCLEFTAYRLLYYIFTKNTLDMTSLMASLSDEDKENECVSFSLAVRAAWSLSNYHKLFSLYKRAPLMSAYLMDWFCERERKVAIKIIAKSYRPAVTSDFVKCILAIEADEEWEAFASSVGLSFTDCSKKVIDTKGTVLSI